jgi:UDP-glucose 4-epimerase
MKPPLIFPWYRGHSVLVTGGAGFIGSHLVTALTKSGARATVFDNCTDAPWPNLRHIEGEYIRIEGDVRDPSSVKGALEFAKPTVIFHLAANASVPYSVEDPRHDFETNTVGTFNVLEGARQARQNARLVFASSAAVYGEPGRELMTEETRLCPISPYGASKLGGEIECRLYAELFSTDVVIGRIFNSFGPRMPRFVVLDFLRKLSDRQDVLEILGTGMQTRDFTYVLDTVAGLLTLGQQGIRGEAYNIASGSSHSVTDLAHQLLAILDLSQQTKLRYSGDSWAGDAQYWAVSIDKLKQLGYRPQFNLGDGLSEVVAWFNHREPPL